MHPNENSPIKIPLVTILSHLSVKLRPLFKLGCILLTSIGCRLDNTTDIFILFTEPVVSAGIAACGTFLVPFHFETRSLCHMAAAPRAAIFEIR